MGVKARKVAAAAARQVAATAVAAAVPEAAAASETVTAEAKTQAQTAAATEQRTLFRGYDELAQLGQGNFDAVVQANTRLAKGAEEIGRELMDYAQATVEQTAVAAKALLGVRTLQDVVALNSEFAKGNVERFLANSAKLSDLAARVATEALEPLTARVTLTVERLVKPAAV